MKVSQVIEFLRKDQVWVNWNQTRDHLLQGDFNLEVKRIGVCWVATKRVIEEAQKKGINFIITHENPFYDCSTNPKTPIYDATLVKQAMLKEADIAIYRCHDGWDMFPEYGVSDCWAKRLGFPFRERVLNSFNQFALIETMHVYELAKHVANSLYVDGEDGAYVFGDIQKKVTRLAMGTGAATDIYSMLIDEPDAIIVSDDGITNWNAAQFAIDHNIPLIVVNHAGCEICGMKGMEAFFHKFLPQVPCEYVYEGFDIHYYIANKEG